MISIWIVWLCSVWLGGASRVKVDDTSKFAAHCSYSGHWKSEDGHVRELQVSGASIRLNGQVNNWYRMDRGVLKNSDGAVGTLQRNCNVILWGGGGIWMRLTGSEALTQVNDANDASASGCSYNGRWKSEDGHVREIQVSGASIRLNGQPNSWYRMDRGVLKNNDGAVGSLQHDCNVVLWSGGGTWMRLAGCSYTGRWKSEDGHVRELEVSGKSIRLNGQVNNWYRMDRGVLKNSHGAVGSLQRNCNVISWSNGGIWKRKTGKQRKGKNRKSSHRRRWR